jgi:transcriptional regulator with XRE-family HTH domain
MDLKKWLELSHMTQIEFALLLGLTNKYHFNRIANKKKIPSRALALKIEQVTKGAVTAVEVLFPKRVK